MQIIEQGFKCSDQQYYQFCFLSKSDIKRRVPVVCLHNGHKQACALVSKLEEPNSKSYKYLKLEELTEELKAYISQHKQPLKS